VGKQCESQNVATVPDAFQWWERKQPFDRLSLPTVQSSQRETWGMQEVRLCERAAVENNCERVPHYRCEQSKKKGTERCISSSYCSREYTIESTSCVMSRSAKCGETHWRKNLGRFMYFYASVESNNSTICRGVVAQDDFP